MAECEACGGEVRYGKCKECGAVSRNAAPSVRAEEPRRCPLDGSPLHANGHCEHGQGFPVTLKYCPDVCPHCRSALAWNGDCYACRPEGEKPGHLYDHGPDGHWRILTRGPQPFALPEVAKEAMTRITELLQRVGERTKPIRVEPHEVAEVVPF